VLELFRPSEHVEVIGIVVNEKGAERAARTGAVQTLGFPYSTSPQFLERNQHQTPEQALDAIKAVIMLARDAGMDLVAYLSMAFGNPYGDPWSVGAVVDACDSLIDCGVRHISLADTVGMATPGQIGETVSAVLGKHRTIEIGVHLHARAGEATERICAAFDAGCRRFDAAIGGLGGCPFAQDALVGNIPTETLITVLAERGARLPMLGPLEDLKQANAKIASSFGALAK